VLPFLVPQVVRRLGPGRPPAPWRLPWSDRSRPDCLVYPWEAVPGERLHVPSASNDPTVLHSDYPVGHIRDTGVVCHHENGAVLLASELNQEVDNLAAGFTVQR